MRAASLVLAFMVFSPSITSLPASAATTTMFASIEPSLALVISVEGKHVHTGTAFCVGSHDDVAYFLTNRDVLGTDTYPRMVLLSDRASLLHGEIVRTATADAVVLAVHHAACQPLSLSASAPVVGTEIGIAGFPAIQFSLANDLSSIQPSFHQGSVSSMSADGSVVEYDAQTDRGNSGSPLFDMQTGVVYALVTAVDTGTTGALQNNLAISVPMLQTFLNNAHANVSFASGGVTSSVALAATGSVGSLVDTHCGQGSTNTMLKTLERSYAELNGNDYSTASLDARQAVELSSVCAVSLYQNCQSVSPCNDGPHTLIENGELMGQQILRIATARSGGDWANAERNEIATALDLCASPNIETDAPVYRSSRGLISESCRILR
jgi:hypothetical protein